MKQVNVTKVYITYKIQQKIYKICYNDYIDKSKRQIKTKWQNLIRSNQLIQIELVVKSKQDVCACNRWLTLRGARGLLYTDLKRVVYFGYNLYRLYLIMYKIMR